MEAEESNTRLGWMVGPGLDVALSLNTASSVSTSLEDIQ